MDSAQWMQLQEIGESKYMGEISGGTMRISSMDQRKVVRPQRETALNCPRCHSTNTKFCYYNNYSLNQPRYLCKNCRRYWTEGGTLRSVPVGGGSRKNNKKYFSSSSCTPTSNTPPSASTIMTLSVPVSESGNKSTVNSIVIPDLNPSVSIQPEHHQQLFPNFPRNPKLDMSHDRHLLATGGQYLNLGATRAYNYNIDQSEKIAVPPPHHHQFLQPKLNNESSGPNPGLINGFLLSSSSASSSSSSSSAAHFLRNNNNNGRQGFNIPAFSPEMGNNNNNGVAIASSGTGFPFIINQECKQETAELSFPFDHHHDFSIGMNSVHHISQGNNNIATIGNKNTNGFIFPFGANKGHKNSVEAADRDGNSSEDPHDNIINSNKGYWNGVFGEGQW